MGELLPCPFCGNAPNPDPQNDDCPVPAGSRADGEFYLTIWCEACGAEGGKRLTRADAITAWNTRPRTEGRGDEPVAWQEAAEPFFRLAREVINPVNGERPWHADSKDWMVVFSFAGQSVTLGDLRRAAVASPIREPEISREAVDIEKVLRQATIDYNKGAAAPGVGIHEFSAQRVAAILNLAPVAKGVSHDADLSDEFDRPGRLSDATRHSAEGTADPALSGARGVGEGWRPISEAPRDGTYILAHVADRDADDRWAHLAGRAFVVRHEGKTSSGYDLGWSVHPGFGGCADDWFSCWQPLPPPPQEQGGMK